MATPLGMLEVHKMVELLSAEFKIDVPRVQRGTGRTSWCHRTNGVLWLTISVNDWHGIEGATLHEFAHVLCWLRYKSFRHEQPFYRCLKEVIHAWRGEVRSYEWDKEYWTLWNYAKKEGLTDKIHHRSIKNVTTVSGGFRRGDQVMWSSPRFGHQKGIVISAYSGCRARVNIDDGRCYFVPQNWLLRA